MSNEPKKIAREKLTWAWENPCSKTTTELNERACRRKRGKSLHRRGRIRAPKRQQRGSCSCFRTHNSPQVEHIRTKASFGNKGYFHMVSVPIHRLSLPSGILTNRHRFPIPRNGSVLGYVRIVDGHLYSGLYGVDSPIPCRRTHTLDMDSKAILTSHPCYFVTFQTVLDHV